MSEISGRSLKMMDKSMKNYKKGKVSEPLDDIELERLIQWVGMMRKPEPEKDNGDQ